MSGLSSSTRSYEELPGLPLFGADWHPVGGPLRQSPWPCPLAPVSLCLAGVGVGSRPEVLLDPVNGTYEDFQHVGDLVGQFPGQEEVGDGQKGVLPRDTHPIGGEVAGVLQVVVDEPKYTVPFWTERDTILH